MTQALQRIASSFLFGLAAGMVCLLSPARALAEHGAPPPPEGHSDGLAYLLVIFCVALSIIILARGSNRSPDMRLKELEEE